MDKNSIIGLVLIALVMFGFTFYQGKRAEKFAAEQAYRDSVELAARIASGEIDTTAAVVAAASVAEVSAAEPVSSEKLIYKDSLLNESLSAAEQFVTLENDKLVITFTTKGAQPYSVKLKDFYNYDSTALHIFNPGQGEYSVSVYAGEYIRTGEMNFQVAECTDTSLVMVLPFAGGGRIEQRYAIHDGSYSVDNVIGFKDMGDLIPRNVSSVDIDFGMVIPRMEKGYKNESQYSKLDYYFEGDKKPSEMGRGRSNSKRIDSKLSWFAFQQQFFSAIVRAPRQFASGELSINFCPQDDPERNLMKCSALMRTDIRPGADIEIPMEFYFGPNHYQTLNSYGYKYEKIIPLGGWLVGWFTRFVIIPLFNFFHRFFDNFGLIILLMTLVIKTVVLPFTNKSFLSSAKMAALKPEMDKINARYPKQEDAMKKQQATMDLYKRAGVSPMGGCLPTLITFPILWAMFRFFPASIELRQQSFLWCNDLSAYDSIVDFGTRVPLLGDHLSLFALLMAATMWFYSKMTMANQSTANDPSAASMKFMTLWMMPIMMFFICNSVSAALSYYYLLSQLYSIAQNFIIKKFFVKPDEILAKLKASEGKPLPKSKFQQRLEEAQKMQQQQARQQSKRR
ncbi:MAG: membrane protein insertase YidC [Bacteroidales bacterium]|nr:membrane protein insertase YidC [Bacteroidales bacterium]